MPNANDNSDAGAIGRSLAVAGSDTRLPSLSSLITGPDPEREFGTLIQRLVVHQARNQGLPVEASSLLGVTILPKGGILRMRSLLVVWPAWSLQNSSGETIEVGLVRNELVHSQFAPSGPAGDVVLVLPVELSLEAREELQRFIQLPVGRLHPVGATECLEWLRACPSLLARYLPQDAAQGPDSQGFSLIPFTGWVAQFAPRLVNALRDLQLFGFPPARRPPRVDSGECSPRTFKLDQVFVPQNLSPLGGSAKPPQTLGNLETKAGPFVLLGDPGSGKTSILRYLAGTCAGQHHPSEQCPVRRVPLFLPLREYSKLRGTNRHATLLGALCQYCARAASLEEGNPHPWHIEALIEMGEALVLFDGLDEAGGPDARR